MRKVVVRWECYGYCDDQHGKECSKCSVVSTCWPLSEKNRKKKAKEATKHGW